MNYLQSCLRVLLILSVTLSGNSCKIVNDSVHKGSIFKVAYVSAIDSIWNVFLINSDGTNVANFTNSDVHCRLPQFTPQGDAILFHMMNNTASTSTVNTWVIKSIENDTSIELLERHSGIDFIKFSPDGLKLVFSYSGSIFTVNRDGSNRTEIFNHDDYFLMQPSFSPDGSIIIFQGGTKIFSIDVNGTNFKLLLEHDDYLYSQQFSPDGKRIYFHTRTKIFYIELNNQNPAIVENIIDGIDVILNMKISHDGSKIIYQKFESGNNYIYTADSNGGNIKQLCQGETPHFSSDLTKIVFNRRAEIYIMNVDGTNEKLLCPPGSFVYDLRPF